MKLENKVCVVTGAGSGMGRSLAIQLSTKENIQSLAICDINEKALLETVQICRDMGSKVPILSTLVDVSNRKQVENWKNQVVEKLGGCDLLINNAGINANGKMVYDATKDDVKLLEENWERCFQIDFYGVLYCIREFLPILISRKEAHLVNCSSVNSFWVWPEHTCYCAAKSAVTGLTNSLMLELKVKAPHVKVSLLHPGGIKTNIAANILDPNNHDQNPQARVLKNEFENRADLSSEEAAEWILGVQRDQYRVLVGYDAWLIDKMVRIFPTKVYDFYDQVGKEGLTVDVFDPSQKNSKIMTRMMGMRIFLAGLWVNALFLWPMEFIKHRRSLNGKMAMLAARAGGVAAAIALFSTSSKL